MDEDARAYAELIGLLREANLGWVSDEIEETVREGEVDVRALPAREARALYQDADISAGRAVAVERRPFTPSERLAVAVTAVRRVTVDISAMEAEIRQSLSERVYVADDLEGAQREAILAGPPDRLSSTDRLSELLHALGEPSA